MTNEELIQEYQNGNTSAVEQLWLNVSGFIEIQADKYLQQFPAEYQSHRDDMIQQAYFSLLYAAERFDISRGVTFLTYFSKCIPKAFHEVIFNGRGSRQESDPLNSAMSLDRPLYENDDGSVVTLADTIAEPCKELEDIETDDYWKSVNTYMKEIFRKHGTEIGAEILCYMIDNDCSFRDAVLTLYGDDIRVDRKVRSKYEYHLKETKFKFKKHWKNAKEERQKLLLLDELFIGSNGLRDTGYKFFSETGMSSVEHAVFRRNQNNE